MGISGQIIENNSKQVSILEKNYQNRKTSWQPILEQNEDEISNQFDEKNGIICENNGWIRVFCGPDRSDMVTIEPSRMVHSYSTSTAKEIVKSMNLPESYALWMQIGGSSAHRLDEGEYPLAIQEKFFEKLGYTSKSRRCRLEIDPEMKYLIRFYIGPAEISLCRGINKSGRIDILKGLVFPQWKKRSVAIFSNYLIVFPDNIYINPEIFDISGADIIEYKPRYERLILKIVPKITCENNNFYLKDNNNFNYRNIDLISSSSSSLYNSSCSLSSISERDKILFLGFEESWERDLWSAWLLEATTEVAEPRKLNINSASLQSIPEIIIKNAGEVEELSAGQNRLQEIGIQALAQFSQLHILRLPGNGFTEFPISLLDISGLTVLDLADNLIEKIPNDISKLKLLEELCIDRNEIKELPSTLRQLRHLKSLQAANNYIIKLPNFLIKTRTMGLVDMYAQKTDNKLLNKNNITAQERSSINHPLNKVSLRANQLKGNIILGSYSNLTQLDLSENDIETMDLTALGQLESLQCCRNKLEELNLNGSRLNSIIAGNNSLKKLTINPTPTNLSHLDVSYNKLVELPEWLNGCHQLRTLFANNNQLKFLPENLFSNELKSLCTLQIGYNNLTELPSISKKKLPIREIFLQSNFIKELPSNFFNACENLILLNISNNKLCSLPKTEILTSQLERLYLTKNNLNDRQLIKFVGLKNLRILHAAFNELTSLPEECIRSWPDVEEIVLSGNKLKYLPNNISHLKSLRVLRVHSNQLQTVPLLSNVTTLRVLDLAHNQLDKINLVTLLPKKLQFLDLSCNFQLQVDPQEFKVCRSERPMSLIDVSGKNRSTLPSVPDSYQENADIEPPWKLGFSETAGCSSKLYISQLRLPSFCNTEGLFGMFDGELNNKVPNILVKTIPKILLEERTVKETANEYIKYTLLTAHKELKHEGQKQGVSTVLCHIYREKITSGYSGTTLGQNRRYILNIASVGENMAYLKKSSGIVCLTPVATNRQIGNSANYPKTLPDPNVNNIILDDDDKYLIIGNKKLWEVMDIESVVDEIEIEKNVILAAKRIQDIAQSYGAEENLSILIVKFINLKTDIETVIRELRNTVRRKSNGIITGFCKCGCCCESNNNCCHSAGSNQFIRQISGRSDRSSPSGQSDQTGSELLSSKSKIDTVSTIASRKSNYTINEKRSLRGSVARAVRAKIEEEREHEREYDIDDTDSALSEEQFKCWEYILAQNTQLLFDKELNTISKAFTKNKSTNNISASIKSLSASSPQLVNNDKNLNSIAFLSKHFGSARSFEPQPAGYFKGMHFNSGRLPPIGGGPNAAYFGSLQRLMPYNLEYDFNLTKERGTFDDSLEYESRMRQYWDVATTEL